MNTRQDMQPASMLAILLGASTFPKSPQLHQGRFFYNSAADVMEYLTDPGGMALMPQNLLWLFDDSRSSSDQLVEIAEFLTRRDSELKPTGSRPLDLLIYYVGHGLFTRGAEQAYCLALRTTNEINEGATSMRASELAGVIKDRAAFMRRYLILDCCFAASIYKEFQSGPLSAAHVQIKRDFPERGTAVMCSSNAYEPARAPLNQVHTMFSAALIRVLRQGYQTGGPRLSFSEIGDLVTDTLRRDFPDNWVRPEVHSPDQREGNIANLPLFPNPAFSSPAAATPRQKIPAPPLPAVDPPQKISPLPAASQPVAPKPKVVREAAKRVVEATPDEKKRAAQDAAAERVLERTRRERARQLEQKRLARKKEEEEETERPRIKEVTARRQEEKPKPAPVAVRGPGLPASSKVNQPAVPVPAFLSKAAAESTTETSAWTTALWSIPIFNVVGYLPGLLFAYQAHSGISFLRNSTTLTVCWIAAGFLSGLLCRGTIEGVSSRKDLGWLLWYLWPGFLIAVFRNYAFDFSNPTLADFGAALVSVVAFVGASRV